jgi:ubiquinone/menaquinone biosynthesis C-methylase UbiE
MKSRPKNEAMNPATDRSPLSRVLEPEVMDSPEEARDYDAMDHGEVNRRFVADFLRAQYQAGLRDDAPILDLGTGTALIPIEVCLQNPGARLVAIDLAAPMLDLARENVARRGLSERIVLQLADAKRLTFSDARFSVVISNSIVHHLPEPRTALAEALRVLKPGGLVFVRDLARPRDDRQVRSLVDAYAAGCNDHQRQLFEASLRAALCVEEIRSLVAQLGFDPASVQATSDRHWTWSAVKQ